MSAGPVAAVSLFAAQLEGVTRELAEFQSRAEDPTSCSDVMSVQQAIALNTRALAAIERIAGKESVYFVRAESFRLASLYEQRRAVAIVTVAAALLADLREGYTTRLAELVRGEVFADFLEMAAHLLASDYKDAAAVIAGSALEAHMKSLAKLHHVAVERETNGGMVPKKADLLNADLAKAGAYGGLEQKSVTAWLDLRNKAAHGEYDRYGVEQVRLMVDAVRDFILRHPA